LRDTLARVSGLAVFAECLAGALACQHTGSGNALEGLCGGALYKYTFIFLYLKFYLKVYLKLFFLNVRKY